MIWVYVPFADLVSLVGSVLNSSLGCLVILQEHVCQLDYGSVMAYAMPDQIAGNTHKEQVKKTLFWVRNTQDCCWCIGHTSGPIVGNMGSNEQLW